MLKAKQDNSKIPKWLLGYSAVALTGEAFSAWLLSQPTPKVEVRWQDGAGPDGASPPAKGAEAWPFISIIVPARNEERNLPILIPSLLNQDYPRNRFEAIVVDDQSTDKTPEILAGFAADPRLHVIQGSPLPEGWKGKPWAMKQGAAAAHGDWLLFTDADTVHHPATLTSTITMALAEKADLFTITPCLQVVTPVERLVMPITFMGIAFLYPSKAVNDPKSKTAIANGQFILVNRKAYDEVGGVDAVHTDIAEDLEFGRLIKRTGHRLFAADGRDLLNVRMYTNGREVWEGWRKNVLLSFKKQPIAGVQSFFMMGAALLPFVQLANYGWRVLRGKGTSADQKSLALVSAQVAGIIALKRRIDQSFDLPIGWAFSFPLGMLVFALILLDSFRLIITGRGVTWKGRSYTK